MKIETNESLLLNNVTLKEASILDIGCGAGEIVRFMSDAGGVVTGLECNEAQLALAQSHALVGGEQYRFGFGQEDLRGQNPFNLLG